MAIIKQAESGVPVPELFRDYGISSASFYKSRVNYGGMDALSMDRINELEEENQHLKKMFAEEWLKSEIIQEVMTKKWRSHLRENRWLWCDLLIAGLLICYQTAPGII
jgi:putative transposase